MQYKADSPGCLTIRRSIVHDKILPMMLHINVYGLGTTYHSVISMVSLGSVIIHTPVRIDLDLPNNTTPPRKTWV